MRQPLVTGFPARHAVWRHIGGQDFQQVRPYTLVAQPDPARPDLLVWLTRLSQRDEPALWSAVIVRGTTRLSEWRGRSAGEAVRRVMACQTWTTAPAPVVVAHGVARDPYPDNEYRTPAGYYPDKGTAHDRRWDSPRGL